MVQPGYQRVQLVGEVDQVEPLFERALVRAAPEQVAQRIHVDLELLHREQILDAAAIAGVHVVREFVVGDDPVALAVFGHLGARDGDQPVQVDERDALLEQEANGLFQLLGTDSGHPVDEVDPDVGEVRQRAVQNPVEALDAERLPAHFRQHPFVGGLQPELERVERAAKFRHVRQIGVKQEEVACNVHRMALVALDDIRQEQGMLPGDVQARVGDPQMGHFRTSQDSRDVLFDHLAAARAQLRFLAAPVAEAAAERTAA